MPDEFSITRDIARREVERHHQRIVGITASSPVFKDINGKLEWTVHVRVGVKEGWALIRDVAISEWAIGIVNDMNVPVTLERSEAGRLTIIARSVIRVPNVVLDTYTANDLGRIFILNHVQSAGSWYDGFGHAVTDPTTQTGQSAEWIWRNDLIEFDSADFEYGETPLDGVIAEWQTKVISRPED